MKTRASDRSYVYEGGILSRSPNKTPLWKFVEWKRVAALSLLAVTLYTTNPANGVLPVYYSFPKEDVFAFGRPSVTNYGFFSVECTLEGIGLAGVLTRYDNVCPFYSPSELGSACGSLADAVCHQKPFFVWDYPPVQHYFQKVSKRGLLGTSSQDAFEAWNDLLSALSVDRVHVCHRCLCFLLMASWVWAFCCPRFPSFSALWFRNSLSPVVALTDLWTAVFSRSTPGTTNLFRDLWYQTIFVYPVLVALDRILPKLRRTSWLVRPTGNETTDYLIAVFLGVLVLGGGSNLLASRIVGIRNARTTTTVGGFSAVAAVSLGYMVRSSSHSRSSILATFGRRDVHYAHAFWTTAVWLVVGNPHRWYPRLVSWLLAGAVGCLYAEFHQQHVDVLVFSDLWSYFGF